MILKHLLAALCLVALVHAPAWAGQAVLAPAADALAREVQAGLERMDRALAQAAGELAAHDLAGPEARGILRGLLDQCPVAIDVCTVDLQGRIVAMEPEAYRDLEGADISGQEQVRLLWRTRRPVMSQVLRTVEGVEAVDLEHPVLDKAGGLRGSVSVLFRPDALLAAALGAIAPAPGLEPWAMDALGRILYDQDRREVDRLLFSDDLYRGFPELLAIGRRMLAERQGEGSYSFPAQGGRTAVTKACAWATVELHAVWWRVVVARPRP